MKKYLQEFKEFAVKGNVVDLAVAVIIGGAFGKIVSSLVADVVMPFIGLLVGGLDFSSWSIVLRPGIINEAGAVIRPDLIMNIGIFVQNVFDFLIIALVIFTMVKFLGSLKKKLAKQEERKEEVPAPLTKDQEILSEIRDLLKNK